MASLREVTDVSRRILVIGFLIIVGIILLIFLINFVKSLLPAPVPLPTVAFGKLPSISFPSSVTNANFQFSLDTLSGNLPSLSTIISVYRINKPQPILGALDNAKNLVSNMGFNGSPTAVSDVNYKWINTDNLPKTLTLNIFTQDFNITSPYLTNQDILQGNNLPDQNTAINTVMNFLQNSTLLPSDIDINKTKATLLGISNGSLIPATSLSSAQIIQIDLFQSNIDGLSIFYPQPTHSTMSLMVGGGNGTPQIVGANFYHQQLGSEKATYPIISSSQAFKALKDGNAYIASYDGTGTNIAIRNAVLGYYMGDKSQQYLQPIIVFEGDHGFFAYIPAISQTWISK